MHIRPAGRSDLERVSTRDRAEYGDHAYPPTFFRQALDLWPSLFLVAEGEGCALLGYAVGAPAQEDGVAWVLATLVAPEARGKGAGRRLMRDLLDALRARGYRQAWLTVAPDNHAALGLYLSLGFARVADEADYFGPGEPRAVLRLDLPPPA